MAYWYPVICRVRKRSGIRARSVRDQHFSKKVDVERCELNWMQGERCSTTAFKCFQRLSLAVPIYVENKPGARLSHISQTVVKRYSKTQRYHLFLNNINLDPSPPPSTTVTSTHSHPRSDHPFAAMEKQCLAPSANPLSSIEQLAALCSVAVSSAYDRSYPSSR